MCVVVSLGKACLDPVSKTGQQQQHQQDHHNTSEEQVDPLVAVNGIGTDLHLTAS